MKNYLKKINSRVLLVICMLCVQGVMMCPANAQDQPGNLPAGYRYIGKYQLKSKVRVENGASQAVIISPLIYRVFSDGIEVRVYCKTAGEDNYTAYQIYRSDGVGVANSDRGIELIAGVQAYSTKAQMLRQISVTRNSLTMVKTPPRSHRVIITRAVSLGADHKPETVDQ